MAFRVIAFFVGGLLAIVGVIFILYGTSIEPYNVALVILGTVLFMIGGGGIWYGLSGERG